MNGHAAGMKRGLNGDGAGALADTVRPETAPSVPRLVSATSKGSFNPSKAMSTPSCANSLAAAPPSATGRAGQCNVHTPRTHHDLQRRGHRSLYFPPDRRAV